MKKIYSLLVIILFCSESHSKNFSVRYETGIGQYNLKEIRDIQTNLRAMVSDLDVKSVVRFPSTLYYGIEAEYLFNKTHALGVHLFYNTTAGRNHLADYSGEYKLDILLSSYAAGIDYRYTFSNLGKFSMSAFLGVGMRFSTFKIKEDLTVYRETISHSDDIAHGTNFYTFPAIEISYPLLSKLDLKLKVGYEIDFRSKYVSTNDAGEQQTLHYNGDKPLNIDYSGLRMGVGISYKF
jgi:hypothetical protein